MTPLVLYLNHIYVFNPESFQFEHEHQKPLSFEEGQHIIASYQTEKTMWEDYFSSGHTRYVHVIERHRTQSISILITPETVKHGMALLRTVSSNKEGIIQTREESFMSLLDPRCPRPTHIKISSSSMSL